MLRGITKTGEPPVSYERAKLRVRETAKPGTEYLANNIAYMVWPKNRMRTQGAALAVGKILRRMLDDGVLKHCHLYADSRGYEIVDGFEARAARAAKAGTTS